MNNRDHEFKSGERLTACSNEDGLLDGSVVIVLDRSMYSRECIRMVDRIGYSMFKLMVLVYNPATRKAEFHPCIRFRRIYGINELAGMEHE